MTLHARSGDLQCSDAALIERDFALPQGSSGKNGRSSWGEAMGNEADGALYGFIITEGEAVLTVKSCFEGIKVARTSDLNVLGIDCITRRRVLKWHAPRFVMSTHNQIRDAHPRYSFVSETNLSR